MSNSHCWDSAVSQCYEKLDISCPRNILCRVHVSEQWPIPHEGHGCDANAQDCNVAGDCCLENGACFPRRECSPITIANGHLTYDSISSVTVECEDAHDIIGNPKISCINGQWTPVPICRLKKCPDLSQIFSGQGNSITHYACTQKFDFGSSCTLSCNEDPQHPDRIMYNGNLIECLMVEGEADWSVYPVPYCIKPLVFPVFDWNSAVAALTTTPPTGPTEPGTITNAVTTPQCKFHHFYSLNKKN